MNIWLKKINIGKKRLPQLALLTLALLSLALAPAQAASDITPSAVIKLVNEARQKAELPALTASAELQSAAEAKAQDMFERDYFAHVSPEGKTPWDFILAAGYDYRYAGENLAISFTNLTEQHKAWMESPLHRKNILNLEYREIGVAVKRGTIEGQKTTITVQEFGAKVQTLQPAATENKLLKASSAVAGLSAQKVQPARPASAYAKTLVSEIKLGKIYSNNRLTLSGWAAALILALLITAADLLLLSRKKARELFKLEALKK